MAKARKMLSDYDAPFIQALVRLVETQSKVTLAHWELKEGLRAITSLISKCEKAQEKIVAGTAQSTLLKKIGLKHYVLRQH